MKKIVLTSVCALSIAAGAFAQGTLNWGAIIPTYMTAQTNSTTISPLYGGGSADNGSIGATAATVGGFYYELLWSSGAVAGQPSTLEALASWNDTGLSAANATTAGRISPTPSNTGAAVNGWAAGAANNLLLVGWSSNLGTSWTQVLATLQSPELLIGVSGQAFFGMSSVGNVVASAGNPGTTIFGTGVGQINSPNTQLYLVQVPEPGTMALAALGGASLLLFRRRK